MAVECEYAIRFGLSSTLGNYSSVGKEWPIGRNHSFPHLIIEVFEANNRVTADGEPVDAMDY